MKEELSKRLSIAVKLAQSGFSEWLKDRRLYSKQKYVDDCYEIADELIKQEKTKDYGET